MEWRGDEEGLAKLWGKIPVVPASPSVVDHPSPRQFLHLNNINNNYINNNNLGFPENPFSPETSSHSFDSAFVRRLPLDSFNQSPFVSSYIPSSHNSHNSVSSASVLGNPAVSQGQGFPSLFYQQMQETVMELQRLRIQEAIVEQTLAIMRARAAPPSIPVESFAVSRSNPNSIDDTMSSLVNVCDKYCCQHRNNLQPPRLSSRDYAKRSPMMPCSNVNGFRLDSNGHGHCRVDAGNDPLLETNNPYTLRSPLLNQSLNHLQQRRELNHPMYSSLEDFRGQIVELAKDQEGCRFLQGKFAEGRVDEIEMIFAEVKDHVGELMIHSFGNYFVQRLLEVCTDEQMMEVLSTITKEEFQLVTICLNSHGTRAVQKLLEHLTTPEQISCVMMALRPGIVILAKDMNGHHVIRNCLQHFSNEAIKYLLSAVSDHCVEIATDSSGCCVLQLCVGYAQGETRERLIAEITANAVVLAQDPYGNYVVQYILALRIPHVMAAVLRQLEGSYLSLSMQKFSSHVVEKCLKDSTEEQSSKIIKELLGSSNFVGLLEDAYGNYVVQSALLVSKGDTHKAIVDLVKSRIPYMRSNPYGKKILERISARR